MTEQAPIELPPQRRKLRIEDYLLLDESGAFGPDQKTELIDGEVFVMSPLHRPHARIVPELSYLIRSALPALAESLELLGEPSVKLPPQDMPQPDLVIASIVDEDLVTVGSVRLVIEVSDSSLQIDLQKKLVIYASHGIPEYWVADVTGRCIHQHWAPSADGYGKRHLVPFGERIEAATIAGLALETVTL